MRPFICATVFGRVLTHALTAWVMSLEYKNPCQEILSGFIPRWHMPDGIVDGFRNWLVVLARGSLDMEDNTCTNVYM